VTLFGRLIEMQHAMWCSTAGGGSGSVYDILGFAHPFLIVPHNGLPWSSPYLWQTSNLRRLRLGEEKKERRRRKN